MHSVKRKNSYDKVIYQRLHTADTTLNSSVCGSLCNMSLAANFQRATNWLPGEVKPILAVVGGFLVHLTLGSLYSIGNMTPYIASYLRKYDNEKISYGLTSWLLSMAIIGQGAVTMLGGFLERKFGARISTLTGCIFVSAGVAVSFFTVKVSFWPLAITYSLIFGCGIGVAYTGPLVCATQWFPRYKGVVLGIIVAGFGLGALIFNQVQTLYINPNNYSPDIVDGKDKFFSQVDLLERVPTAFFLLGGCYAILQIVGLILMMKRDEPISDIETSNIVKADEGTSIYPTAVLRSYTFWILWFCFFLNGQSTVFISAFYKPFGQTFIDDDFFFATTGSVASVANAFGRILWGHIGDRFSFQVSMCCVTASLCFFFLTFQYAALAGKAMYFIWVFGIFGSFCGSFALFPFATNRCFGQKYFSVNYGFLFTSQMVTAIISALLSQSLLEKIDYNGMFFLLAGFSAISFVLTTLIGFTKYGHFCQRKPVTDLGKENEGITVDSDGDSSEETEN